MSLLEIARCKSPAVRAVLERTSLFKDSATAIAQLKAVLEKEKPTLVVLGHLDLKLYPLVLHLQQMGQPYGIIAHDSEIYFCKNRVNDRVRRGMIIKGANWIAANSRHTRSLVEAWGIPREKITIIHPPLSEQAIFISNELTGEVRDDSFTLITVSRIVPNKGIDLVLKALQIIDRNEIPFHYIVVGEGPERESLQQLSIDLGLQNKITFTGYISDEDKWRLLQASDLYVMTIEIYAMESAVLRTQKLIATKGESSAALPIAMTRVYLTQAFEKVEAAAKKIIAAVADGDMLRTQLAILRRLAKHELFNTIELRQQIAQKIIERGKYTLG